MPRIKLKNEASSQLAALPQFAQQLADDAMAELYGDARAGRALRGNLRGKWRLRRGPIRIIYKLRDDDRLVIVETIIFRDQAYPRRGH